MALGTLVRALEQANQHSKQASKQAQPQLGLLGRAGAQASAEAAQSYRGLLLSLGP